MADRLRDPDGVAAPFAGKASALEDGIGLCLSGGGYRAMLFHAGVLWRLNELAFLPRLSRISSVSGGSITAAMLGLHWTRLAWHGGVAVGFTEYVIAPLRRLAGVTVDLPAVLAGALIPGSSISDRLIGAYRKHLYGDATLQDLPDDATAPRFVINATSVQTGAGLRFSRRYIADYRVGRIDSASISLAAVVAASSAFPPMLSPIRLRIAEGAMRDVGGSDLHHPPYTTDLVLTDGGVYDNLGLETVWKRYKTVIVSDGGGHMGAQPAPRRDWARHAMRVNALIDSQVRALRKLQIVGSLVRGERDGAYWRMRGRIADYSAPGTLPCPHDRTLALAATPTRLARLHPTVQERIINWGYAICDAAMRTWVDRELPPPAAFPYPASKV